MEKKKVYVVDITDALKSRDVNVPAEKKVSAGDDLFMLCMKGIDKFVSGLAAVTMVALIFLTVFAVYRLWFSDVCFTHDAAMTTVSCEK